MDRFWNKVNKTPTCWNWTACVRPQGYGMFGVQNAESKWKILASHRYSWELHNGPVPEGMCVCHSCDNPSCVNPDHLFLGTKNDNNQDKCRKGRQPRGEQNHSKLTEAQVIEIKEESKKGRSTYELGRVYGVDPSVISRINTGKKWKHVHSA